MRDGEEFKISCHYVHFSSIEDIYLKSSIPGQSSILRVTGSYPRFLKNLAGHKVVLKLAPTTLWRILAG